MLVALNDRLVLKPDEPETTAAGIWLAGPKELPQRFVVTSVGPEAAGFSVGDKVLVARHDGATMDWGGEEHKFVRACDVLAKL